MTVAAIGAIFIQATEEAAMVILLFMLGKCWSLTLLVEHDAVSVLLWHLYQKKLY